MKCFNWKNLNVLVKFLDLTASTDKTLKCLGRILWIYLLVRYRTDMGFPGIMRILNLKNYANKHSWASASRLVPPRFCLVIEHSNSRLVLLIPVLDCGTGTRLQPVLASAFFFIPSTVPTRLTKWQSRILKKFFEGLKLVLRHFLWRLYLFVRDKVYAEYNLYDDKVCTVQSLIRVCRYNVANKGLD